MENRGNRILVIIAMILAIIVTAMNYTQEKTVNNTVTEVTEGEEKTVNNTATEVTEGE